MKKKKNKNLDLSPNIKGNEQKEKICLMKEAKINFCTNNVHSKYCENCNYYKQI